jgi:hypothetical protein
MTGAMRAFDAAQVVPEHGRGTNVGRTNTSHQEDTMIAVTIRTGLLTVAALAATASLATAQTSTPFSGAKVNGGTVTHSLKDGRHVLTLSNDFQVPDTPDPHWQVVDSKGAVYLLQRLPVKSLGGIAKDRINTSITLPAYVRDVVKVQIYCAWAEALLGEASFNSRVTTE